MVFSRNHLIQEGGSGFQPRFKMPRLQAASAFEILETPVTEFFFWKPFPSLGAPLTACF
jgi:hypothetical protein